MRKITSLLTLLLLCVVGASAQITSVSDISETGIYTISSQGRGAWCYNSTDATNLYSTSVAGITVDATSTAQQWQFVKTATEGQFNIKNVETGLFLADKAGTAQNANGWTFSETAGTFTVEQNGSYFHIMQTNTGDWINFSTGWHYGVTGAWTSADDGNNFTITKVADTELQSIEVTYTVTFNGETVATVTRTQFAGDAAVLDAADQKAFVTYTYSPATIETGTTAVAVTATANLPFTPSTSYADAKWYYAKFNAVAGGAWVYDVSADPNVKTPTTYTEGDENAQWAFIGNPYTGYTIINKAAGDGKVLTTTAGAASDGADGGSTYAYMADTDASAMQTWTLAEWSKISGGFTVANSEGVRLNRRNAANLAYWTAADAGSVVSLTAVPDDYSSLVTSDVAPYFAEGAHGGVFQLKDDVYQQYAEQVTAAQTSCTLETYQSLLAVVQTASNFNYPESGYYRIKSYGKRFGTTYICVGANYYSRGDKATGYGLSTIDEATAASDASTYFKLTKQTADDGTVTYKLSSQGEGVVQPTSTNQPFLMTAAEDEGDDFKFTVLDATGKVAIGDASISDYPYFHEAGWQKNADCVVKWNASAEASWWYVEAVEDLTVALNQAGDKYYATLNLPFGADVTGATAYTAAEEDGVLKLTAIDAVPANTPVILVGDAASATISLNTEAPATENTNVLTGTNVAMDWVSSYLTLGKVNEVAGFYTWEGTSLGANKAYIAKDAASAGLAFSFGGTTGIESAVIATDADAKVYDLQGRRVQKAAKGLYIIGGKKVLVK